MDIIKAIFLLNSSYNKQKAIDTFVNTLSSFGIEEFFVACDTVKLASGASTDYRHTLKIDEGGYYNIQFLFNSGSYEKIDLYSLKVFVSAFIVAIENIHYYTNVVECLKEQKNHNSFYRLREDIDSAIEDYKRYGQSFCVAKVSIFCPSEKKTDEAILQLYDILKDNIRLTDKLYDDGKDIYILYKDMNISDGKNVVKKLQSITGIYDIGIAQWQSVYVVQDLFGEIENYIYMSKLKEKNIDPMEEFSKILDIGILRNDDIFVFRVPFGDVTESGFVATAFKHNGSCIIVLRNADADTIKKYKEKCLSFYQFNHEDIASDILAKL